MTTPREVVVRPGVRAPEFLGSLPQDVRLAPALLGEDENSHAKRERLSHCKRATYRVPRQ
jgi:hypothetical protein